MLILLKKERVYCPNCGIIVRRKFNPKVRVAYLEELESYLKDRKASMDRKNPRLYEYNVSVSPGINCKKCYGRANKRDKGKTSRYGLRVTEFVDSKNKEIIDKLEEIKKELREKHKQENP